MFLLCHNCKWIKVDTNKFLVNTLNLSNAIRKQADKLWKICILLVKCSIIKMSPSSLSDNPNTSIKNEQNLFEEKCIAFKKRLLDIPRHAFYTCLHENVNIRKSVTKGHYATITDNKDAFEILGVEEPIAYIIFDPQEYQWRRLPSSSKRYHT